MVLLGGGGAATAIAVQAALDGVSQLSLFNRQGRSWQRAQKLADTLNDRTGCRVSLFDIADSNMLKKELADSYLLTNATPVGMAPDTGVSPVPDITMLHEELIVSDVIYNPRRTKLMEDAQSRGCRTCNGLYMLLYQGAEAFRLWTGCDMPVEEIKAEFFK